MSNFALGINDQKFLQNNNQQIHSKLMYRSSLNTENQAKDTQAGL